LTATYLRTYYLFVASSVGRMCSNRAGVITMARTNVHSSSFTITVDNQEIQAMPGQTVAAAMMAAGIKKFRSSVTGTGRRGVFCGMGVCWECAVEINGQPHVRACITEAQPGMVIRTDTSDDGGDVTNE